MNVPAKLTAFAAVLVLAFGAAALAGAAIDPTDEPVAGDAHSDPAAGSDAHGGGHDTAAAPAKTAARHGAHESSSGGVGGLAVTEGGYRLEFDRTQLTASRSVPLRFRIADQRGRVVRDEFQVEHEKRLHLVLVRRDTKVFRHVHPEQQPDGSWTIDANLIDAGTYRAFADFKIDGQKRTLGADLFVPGTFEPRPLPEPRSTDRAVNDTGSPAGQIDVSLKAPGVRAGRESELTFSATQGGRPLSGLDPYLGAKGHLVALREGDLAYLHVHPTDTDTAADHDDAGHDTHKDDAAGSANTTRFAATFPTAGRYRLFLQFKVAGQVRTVDYTLEVPR